MQNLPSKELLSAVLGHKVWKVLSCNMGTLRYCIYPNKGDEPSEYIFPINIYELASKCKEWALSKDYYLRAEQGINYNDNLQWTCFLNINMDDGAEYIDYWNSTEPEAIFKACQWILDNKD